MPSLHRRLLACFRALVWALCLAVPLQAAAVAARGSLHLPTSAPTGNSASVAVAAMVHADHHAAAIDADANAARSSALQPPCHGDGDSAEAPAPASHHAQHKCSSSCAACCIASALPSAAAPLPVTRGGDVLASTPSWATLSCSSARLERPPRAS
jgi:hypothetical protein